jgi:hypothetical protein
VETARAIAFVYAFPVAEGHTVSAVCQRLLAGLVFQIEMWPVDRLASYARSARAKLRTIGDRHEGFDASGYV